MESRWTGGRIGNATASASPRRRQDERTRGERGPEGRSRLNRGGSRTPARRKNRLQRALGGYSGTRWSGAASGAAPSFAENGGCQAMRLVKLEAGVRLDVEVLVRQRLGIVVPRGWFPRPRGWRWLRGLAEGDRDVNGRWVCSCACPLPPTLLLSPFDVSMCLLGPGCAKTASAPPEKGCGSLLSRIDAARTGYFHHRSRDRR